MNSDVAGEMIIKLWSLVHLVVSLIVNQVSLETQDQHDPGRGTHHHDLLCSEVLTTLRFMRGCEAESGTVHQDPTSALQIFLS